MIEAPKWLFVIVAILAAPEPSLARLLELETTHSGGLEDYSQEFSKYDDLSDIELLELAKDQVIPAYLLSRRLLKRGENEAAFGILSAQANTNHPLILNSLGVSYQFGRGVEPDTAVAALWYERAIDAGSEVAKYNSAYLDLQYDRCREGETIKRLTLVAENLPIAEFLLGQSYSYGNCVDIDEEKGRSLIERSAKRGNELAQFSLAQICLRQAQIDTACAERMLSQAYESGMVEAGDQLEELYFGRATDLADVQKAVELMQSRAESGNPHSIAWLALAYMEGRGVERSLSTGIEMATSAAERGSMDAIAILGSAYAEGKGVPKDTAKAVQLWKKAALGGNKLAQLNYGIALANGYHVEKCVPCALDFLERASQKGSKRAEELIEKYEKAEQ